MGAIRVTAQDGEASSLITMVDLALSGGTAEIQAADADKRPFIDVGSMIDFGDILTSVELLMGSEGSERSVSDVVTSGTFVTTGIIIGNPGERIIVTAIGASGTAKYRITCGLIGPGITGTSV